MKKFMTVKEAVKCTLPVLAGYLVLGAGFGLIMNANGYGIWWALAMSIFIYAGSMQYAGAGMMAGGASLISVALTTLMVNARHLFYGISMTDKYRGSGIAKPYLMFSLTDETYSIVCHGEKSSSFYLAVSLLDQLYWIAGTAIGSLLGDHLPFSTEGMDFALTALFITVFTDQWLGSKRHFPAVSGVILSLLCLIIFGKDNFLIPSMLSITAALLISGFAGGEVKRDE